MGSGASKDAGAAGANDDGRVDDTEPENDGSCMADLDMTPEGKQA